MNKAERAQRFREFLDRSPRDLADVILQAEEGIDRRQKRIGELLREVARLRATLEKIAGEPGETDTWEAHVAREALK